MPPQHRPPRGALRARVEKRIAQPLFTVTVLKNASTKPLFTCVVSKKVAPRAVDRNKLKRKCREAFRPLFRVASPLFIVIYPKKEMLQAPFELVRKSAETVINQLGEKEKRS